MEMKEGTFRRASEIVRCRNEFKGYVVAMFGSQRSMARQLNVTTQTVNSWCNANPRGLLKFAPEVIDKADTTYQELMKNVMSLDEALSDK